MNVKIGIGITTHNRTAVFNKTLRYIKKFTPKEFKIAVVDDGSSRAVHKSDFRFERPHGVAVAKNKCLELLEDCDFIFLFDDDIFPIKNNWWNIYIDAYHRTGIHHFMLIWDYLHNGRESGNQVNYSKDGIDFFHRPAGVLLFLTKKCLETAGGFDVNFGRYGHEHVEYSSRIYNLGLTPEKYCHVHGSLKYFYPHDFYKTITSTMKKQRKELFRQNHDYLLSQLDSKQYKPYKS